MKNLLLILLCVLPVLGLAQEHPLGNALTEARALLNQGKAKEAIAKLRLLPPSTSGQQLLGVAYFRAQDYVRAIETLTPLVTALPKDSAEHQETIQALGMAHYVLGHLEKAVPFFEQTLVWSPNSNELNYALGMACIQTRQEMKGRAAFARIFHVAPDSPAAHLFAAQMMVRIELNHQAIAELKQALTKNPKLPQANFLLGVIAIQLSKYDEAVALLGKEIELNPGNAMAFYRLGDVYTRQLAWDEAIPALQKSVWLNPFYSGPYILLGKSYLKKRDLVNAEAMLRRAIQMDPNNKSAHYMLALMLQQSGRAEEAKREFAITEKLLGSNEQPEK